MKKDIKKEIDNYNLESEKSKTQTFKKINFMDRVLKINILKVITLLILLLPVFIIPNLVLKKTNNIVSTLSTNYKVPLKINANELIFYSSNFSEDNKIIQLNYSYTSNTTNQKKIYLKIYNKKNEEIFKDFLKISHDNFIEIPSETKTDLKVEIFEIEDIEQISTTQKITDINISNLDVFDFSSLENFPNEDNLSTNEKNKKLKLYYNWMDFYTLNSSEVEKKITKLKSYSTNKQYEIFQEEHKKNIEKDEEFRNLLLEKGMKKNEIDEIKTAKNYQDQLNIKNKLEVESNNRLKEINAIILTDLIKNNIQSKEKSSEQITALTPIQFKRWALEEMKKASFDTSKYTPIE